MFVDNPLMMVLAFLTSIIFTAIAATIPPSAGNLVAAIFTATMASFIAGEPQAEAYEKEIMDEDI